jgi:hypothetical protein
MAGMIFFLQRVLTVKKSMIRFRPADLAAEESEQDQYPDAKHDQ